MNRQNQALLGLFVLLLLAIGYSYWMMPEQKRHDLQRTAPRNEAQVNPQQNNISTQKNILRIDLLEKETTKYKGATRDIFNFAAVYKKPAVKPKPKPKPVAVKPPDRPRPSPVTPAVRQQLARFKLYGFLVKEEALTVFLSRGEDLFLVQEGDRFGDNQQFTALSITREKMIINQANDSRTIEIELVEKEPLVPTMQTPEVGQVNQRQTPVSKPVVNRALQRPVPTQKKWSTATSNPE